MEIDGKHALVTGGATGIGFAITRALVRAGATVLIVSRDKAKLEAVRRLSPNVMTVAADLSVADERERVIAYIGNGPLPIDILVNNAGTMRTVDLTDSDAAVRIDRELALNLHAPVHLATALLPGLLQRPEAAVVNVTTAVGTASGTTPGYDIAKDGLRAFNRSLRRQTHGTGVLVVELMPPATETDLTAHLDGPKAPPERVANTLINGLAADCTEVRPRRVGGSRIAPLILRALGKAASV